MKSLVKWLFLGMALSFAGCSSTIAVPEKEAKFQLYVDVTPKEAVIIVDDAVISTGENTVQVPLKINAGTRRIAIVCDGYHPFKTTLEYIQPGEVYTLTTHLIASEF
ncbi:MAG: hypothetical protein J6S69_02150 [Proteobacteria bacterium]|nr:hypothetical protein [Pseudomonadota bacterium]